MSDIFRNRGKDILNPGIGNPKRDLQLPKCDPPTMFPGLDYESLPLDCDPNDPNLKYGYTRDGRKII